MRAIICLLVLAVLDLGVKDADEGKMATALTGALRTRTKGRFKTGATGKAIQAAIAKADCVVGERACAAAIGDLLGVDYVVVGELDKRGARHLASLSLIDVKAKQRVRSLSDVTSGSDADKWAKSIYQRLVDVDTADLVIYANAEQGEVSLDGQTVAALFNNKATITGIAVGAHRLAIHAKGYKPFDVDVTVDGTTQSFLLDPE